MPATKDSGTILDWLKSIEANHFLPTTGNSLGPTGPGDRAGFVLDGPGDEDYTVTALPDSTRMDVGVGYKNNDLSVDGGTFDEGVIHRSDYDKFPDTYDEPAEWWYSSGGDWFWTVATFEDAGGTTRVNGMGWQAVSRYWDYHELYDCARVAMLLFSDSDNYNPTSGTQRGWGGILSGLAKIDDVVRIDEDIVLNWEETVNPFIGGLTQANTWRATGRMGILKDEGGRTIVGSINAWGVDVNSDQFVPPHTAEVTAGGRTYEYINPLGNANSWEEGLSLFFRTA